MLRVDADQVPKEILQSAKSMVSHLFDFKSDDTVQDMPHDLGGGWPDFDPEDDFLTCGQVRNGPFRNVTAVAKGSNKKARLQGLAVALLLSAHIDDGEVLSEYTDNNKDLLHMAEESFRAWKALVFDVADDA